MIWNLLYQEVLTLIKTILLVDIDRVFIYWFVKSRTIEKNMNSLNTYSDFCTEVYELSKPTPPQEAYQFYRSYADAVNGPLLEPMCGTGRFLLPLVAEGFTVHGLDASKPMLDRLYAKANAQKLKVKVWQRFVREINVQEKYNLIFILLTKAGFIKIKQIKAFHQNKQPDRADQVIIYECRK
jgi:Methyltransferase domain